MKRFIIYKGTFRTLERTIAIDENELGVVNDDDPDDVYTTKPEDWFLPGMSVEEIGQIEIHGDVHLLYPSFGVDADIEF